MFRKLSLFIYIFVFFILSCTSGSEDTSINQEIKKQASSSIVKFDFDLLKSEITPQAEKENIYILLPDGKKGYLEKTKIEYRKNGFTWFGKVKGENLSSVVITVEKGIAFGTININGKRYRIEPFSVEEGLYKIESLKGKKAVPFFDDTVPFFQKKTIKKTSIKPQVAYEDGSRVDILVLYTQQLEDEYGSGITSLAQNLVDVANNAFARSEISTRLHIVGVVKFSDSRASESVDPASALNYISENSTVNSLRESYKADVVTLLRKYTGGDLCGIAYIPVNLPSDFDQNLDYYISAYKNSGFSVVNVGSSGNYYCFDSTLAHEVGHNFGCNHDRDHSADGGAFPYSYGYDIPGSFATIMSYDSPKIDYFSNPNKLYNGQPIGKPEGDPEAADNAKTINRTDVMVANYINRNENSQPANPVITITPTSIDFGSVEAGKSKSSTISVVNTGGGTLNISSVSISGSTDFSITDNCSGKSLTANSSCSITVVFKPSTTGTKTATISINSNASNSSTVNVSVRGTGTEPAVAKIYVYPTGLSFGYLYKGQTKEDYITIKNQSRNSYLQLSFDIPPSDDFTVSHNCPSSLPTLSSCRVTVVFNPQNIGTLEYSFTIKSNDPDNPSIKVPVKGYSMRNPPKIEVSTDSIDFGDVYLGEQKVEKLTIRNKGDKDLKINSMYINSKDFSYTGSCQVIKGGKECSINVVFNPKTKGVKKGKLYIYSNADNVEEGTPVIISLIGNAKERPKPVININPSSIDFGKTVIGNPVVRSIEVQNKGNADLSVEATVDNPAFTVISQCSRIQPGNRCELQVRFTPDKIGKIKGKLTLTTNDPEKPDISIPLQGEGLPIPEPDIDVDKTDFDFGNVYIGNEKKVSISIRNTGTADLEISRIELLDREYFKIIKNNCETVAPSKECKIEVSFRPETTGTFSTSLKIFSNDKDEGLVEIRLKGKGVKQPEPVIKLDKTSLYFGEVQIGNSLEKSIIVKNEGDADLKIESISVNDGDNFSVDSSCSVVKPKDVCSINVIFHPTETGNIRANLVIQSNSGNIGVSLEGKGLSQPEPQITLLTDSLDFGSVVVNKEARKSITVKNTGHADLKINSIKVEGDAFSLGNVVKIQSDKCSVLKPEEKCKITVIFKPTEEKQYTGKVIIHTNDPEKPSVDVPLTGIGLYKPELSIDVDSSDFGTVFIGDKEVKTVILENKGKGTAHILNINLISNTNEFSIESNGCSDTLKSGEKCRIEIKFEPQIEGKKRANLVVESDNIGLERWSVIFVGKGKKISKPQIDIDKDGKATKRDVKEAIEKVLSKEKSLDLNGDNDSDISDIILFLRAIKMLERF